jgi:Protein of unknown function (DUF3014)
VTVERSINKPIIGVAALVFLLALAGVYYLRNRSPALPEATAPQPSAQQHEAEPSIAHPLPAGADDNATAAPLPELADSDAPLRDALAQLSGADTVKRYLLPENVVRRLVVTIDNLPRQKVAVEKRPTAPVAGSFMAEGDELHATIDPKNFERYKPLVNVISQIDMRQLGAVYVHFYPLFQQAYQNLGYPTGYFNDRLVQVIDLLLATPQPPGTIALVRPNVMYTFADPTLEALPAGQKLLIRMGPENAAVIEAKLTELRAVITAGTLKH